jgi:hypothetical protein
MLRQRGKKSSSSSGSGSGSGSGTSHPSSSTTSTTPLVPRTTDTETKTRKPGRPAREKSAPVSSRSQHVLSSTSTEPDSPLQEKTTGEGGDGSEEGDEEMVLSKQSRRTQWIVLAVLSGACAACNGVFAKLYVLFHLVLFTFSFFNSMLHSNKPPRITSSLFPFNLHLSPPTSHLL